MLNLKAPIDTMFTDLPREERGDFVNMVSNSNMSMNSGGGGVVGINSLTVGDTFNDLGGGAGIHTVDAVNHYAGYYWPYWQPYRDYYHECYHTTTTADKFETAFKLSRKLMDKKLVKPMKTIEDFFKLMDAVVEVL